MTNLEKLIEIIKSNNGVELYNWMERFAYWVDPGGYFDVEQWAEYSKEECKVKMTYEEGINISEDFYDTIDFTKFIDDGSHRIEVKDLMSCLEEYYDLSHPELLPVEFDGCFFNFINEDEFAEYLNKRYGYRIITETIEKYWLQIK